MLYEVITDSDSKISNTNMAASTHELTMKGAWKLISYYNYADNKITDTIQASDRITSYNVCYTKLLRLMASLIRYPSLQVNVILPVAFLVNIALLAVTNIDIDLPDS